MMMACSFLIGGISGWLLDDRNGSVRVAACMLMYVWGIYVGTQMP